MKSGKTLLIDGHGLVFRAFFALPRMNAPDGTPTNAVLGFANMFLKVLNDLSPENVAVCFDSSTPSFRKDLFPGYKEGRQPTPEDFKPQIPLVKEFLRLLGHPVLEIEGVEADDLLASLAETVLESGGEVVLLTADKDFLQLLKPGVSILKPVKGISEFENLDQGSFVERFGFNPEHFVTWLSLTGDSVDNIPGIPGVGEKTASSLVSRFNTVEELLSNLDQLPAKIAEKLRTGEDRLKLNVELVTLKKDLPFDPGLLVPHAPDTVLLEKWTGRLGMKQLAKRLNLSQTPSSVSPEPQGSLSLEVPKQAKDFSPLAETLKKPPFALALKTRALPAKNSEVVSAFLFSSDGSCTLFDRSSSLDPSVLDAVLEHGTLALWDLKELSSSTGWEPKAYDRLTDLRVCRYLLHPERPLSAPANTEDSLQSVAFSYLAEAGKMNDELRNLGLEELARTIDLPISPVLAKLEKAGIGVDREELSALGTDLRRRADRISDEISSKTGTFVNLNSPQQVGQLLFEKLGLSVLKTKKTGPSTDASVLEALALDPVKGEIPRLLLEYRELSKLASGFVDAFLNIAEPSTGAIHSTFDPLATATGRLASRDPNVQNLPQFGEWAKRFRKCLVPREKGRLFVSADYSQIELRVLAHLCGDKKLREAFEAGRDIHTETASWVFNVHPSMVTPDLRRAAKAVNFGLLYGMSGHGLAQRLGVGRNDAQSMIERYFAALPSVRDYLENSVTEAKRQGFTRSLFGRIRPLDEVSTANGRGTDALRRIALNTPIQSTAADIAKLAMIAYSKTAQALDGNHPLVLQVHDSIVCETPPAEAGETASVLRQTMESIVSLSVPLTVDIKMGESFAEI